MNHSSIDDKRRLVPRWRSFDKTSLTGELSTKRKDKVNNFNKNNDFFDRHIQAWEKEKNIETASEIIFHSITIGESELSTQQAKYLRAKKNITPELLNLVNSVLAGKTENIITDKPFSKLNDLRKQFYFEINKLKKLLHQWPRSSIYWVEIARLYSALGERDKAYKAIRTALQLDSDNRFVIRCAIRFFIHVSDYDALEKVFSNYKQLYKDQWVLSAYISLHDSLRKKNLKTKVVKSLITNIGKHETTELSASLASLELENGDIKSAKRLFKSSVINPNDNSLAQIAWAEKHVGRIADISKIEVPFDYEAKTRELFRHDQIDQSLENCMQWMIDEPYSITPAITGSYIASSCVDDLDCAIQFCEIGLNANPNDHVLLNNNAFCKAKTGDIQGAIESLKKIHSVEKNTSLDISLRATTGLVMLRNNSIEEGRRMYKEAIELSNKLNLQDHKALAALFLAEEELRMGEKSKEEIDTLIKVNMPKKVPDHLKKLYKKININLSVELQKRKFKASLQ